MNYLLLGLCTINSLATIAMYLKFKTEDKKNLELMNRMHNTDKLLYDGIKNHRDSINSCVIRLNSMEKTDDNPR